jgi:hypothetical protein
MGPKIPVKDLHLINKQSIFVLEAVINCKAPTNSYLKPHPVDLIVSFETNVLNIVSL